MLARGVEQDLEAMILLACVPRITATMGRTGRRFRTQAEGKGSWSLEGKGIRETVVASEVFEVTGYRSLSCESLRSF